ncbi:TPA: phosphoadenylyl-sulfate reductase [Neisseria meningitidis]|uniref:Adenosine 5'-phosphosulfate reductase n=1 Tax=Neisseria meningitidis TaxID=487 RepID=A0A425B4M6_NEIME|nr:phosphoadenylyl-sulfate reductase [Neisseria meningitidis]EGC53028.1 phosophoadenylyl-sulfate reductase [Neisseria meningitidis OX99.30304]EQD07297.1 adenylylsulfate reductase, thioredoxin dependent family protein [Neisseria meningitidis NM151]EQD13251.1 adenylylsulfate reductase, thioredoxin dependent family protein [Neisseria meningitidis NM0552]KER38483.1 phosophoadenylyl-sulfate reductase family protein [Neisseria meningitidis 992008]ADY97556.1 phosophoadenylyl-sulfate reductase [Neisse
METTLLKPALWQIPHIGSGSETALAEKTETLKQRLHRIAGSHRDARFASSLAAEDMVITDLIAGENLNIGIFTLDTGLLHAETLNLLDRIERVYPHMQIKRFQPIREDALHYVESKGRFAFYDSVEARRECCRIRKIEPLNRAIAGADAWLTGQRREQSATRTELPFAEYDAGRGIGKYNPIFDWSEHDVWAYILANNVPYNDLYRQGFPSIGCDPCTRPVKAGEDIRAGRWWWEGRNSKECGLHK